ncbi:UNVERIFIED_CONTAM: hypothetical protein RMT77_008406 [Armadillidium vulgare]
MSTHGQLETKEKGRGLHTYRRTKIGPGSIYKFMNSPTFNQNGLQEIVNDIIHVKKSGRRIKVLHKFCEKKSFNQTVSIFCLGEENKGSIVPINCVLLRNMKKNGITVAKSPHVSFVLRDTN